MQAKIGRTGCRRQDGLTSEADGGISVSGQMAGGVYDKVRFFLPPYVQGISLVHTGLFPYKKKIFGEPAFRHLGKTTFFRKQKLFNFVACYQISKTTRAP